MKKYQIQNICRSYLLKHRGMDFGLTADRASRLMGLEWGVKIHVSEFQEILDFMVNQTHEAEYRPNDAGEFEYFIKKHY